MLSRFTYLGVHINTNCKQRIENYYFVLKFRRIMHFKPFFEQIIFKYASCTNSTLNFTQCTAIGNQFDHSFEIWLLINFSKATAKFKRIKKSTNGFTTKNSSKNTVPLLFPKGIQRKITILRSRSWLNHMSFIIFTNCNTNASCLISSPTYNIHYQQFWTIIRKIFIMFIAC